MKRSAKIAIVFLLLFVLILPGSCFSFKKKKQVQEQDKPKMPETKQQWLQEAQSVPLEERKLEVVEPPKSDKKYYYPDIHYVFEKYNYPQGKKELNIENIKKNLSEYPIIVADNSCHYVAYTQFYFSPDINQISSNFYIGELDSSKTKTRRILAYNHKQKERTPIIEAGTKELYPNLFRGLTLVDWSADGKKLLIKERVGSTIGGVYKTYLYIHFLDKEDIDSGYTIKLTDFDATIKNYFLDTKNLQIVKYRYDIEPLGFSADNDDVIIVLLYFYDKDNNKIFMGTWGYNTVTKDILMYSRTNPSFPISLNGLILKRVLE